MNGWPCNSYQLFIVQIVTGESGVIGTATWNVSANRVHSFGLVTAVWADLKPSVLYRCWKPKPFTYFHVTSPSKVTRRMLTEWVKGAIFYGFQHLRLCGEVAIVKGVMRPYG